MAVENTTCVQPADYEAPNFTPEAIAAVAGLLLALPTAGISLVVTGAAAFSVLRRVLEYILHGKLVCLGGDRCAVGHIAELEPVGYQKPFPDNVDDDFSLNIHLAGTSLSEFDIGAGNAEAAMKKNLATAQAEPIQGLLVTEHPPGGMPEPREKESAFGNYHGYYTWFEGPDYGERFIIGDKQLHIPIAKSPKGPFPVPVFHAEAEGDRVSNLLDVLNNFPPGLGAVCKIPIIGPIACAIVSALLAPVVLVALAIAWAASEGGDPADAGAGTVEVGDLVVATGRWSYDAGHSGWNELHPLKTLQKIPDPFIPGALEDFRKRWCEEVGKAPPVPETPGTRPAGMTPGQTTVWDAQQRPENDWELHPAVDGCAPAPAPPPPPPIIH